MRPRPRLVLAQLSAALLFVLLPVTIASASPDGSLALRPTKVVVQCKPEVLNPGKTSECTFSVSDTGAGQKVAPTGTITVATSGPGSFDQETCTLVPAVTAAKCSVRYTAAQIGTGIHVITASYAGDDAHAASTKSSEIGVAAPNDDRRAAVPLRPPPSTVSGTLVGATYSYSDPDAECADLDGTVWYRFAARKPQRAAIRLLAHGKLDAAVAVFQLVRSQYKARGCAPTDDKGVAELSLEVKRGGRYLLLVGSRADSARSTFRVELFAPPEARPPGAALPRRGTHSKLDPLVRPEEAWWATLVAGHTYRINLAPDKGGCLSLSLYAPKTRSFRNASPLRHARCGGYLVFTPGPDGGGRYVFLVEAEGGGGGVQGYRLDTAPAGADDTAPGVTISNLEKRHGSVSSRGVDVVDLYRFEVLHRSDVTLLYQSSATLRFDLALISSEGARIGCACDESGEGKLRTELDVGEYYVAVRALGRSGGKYSLSLLIREITATTATVDGLTQSTAALGQYVALGALVTPAAAVGGPIRLQVDRFDPIEGWQFARLFNRHAGSGGRVMVSWKPPTLGRWRLHAVFRGSRAASPSKSRYAYLLVQSRTGS